MRIRCTVPALADLEAIFDYIAARSPQGARRVQQRLKVVIDLLTVHPHIGRWTSDPVIRRLVVRPYDAYLVFYEASGDAIIIHAIRHAARDPSAMPGA